MAKVVAFALFLALPTSLAAQSIPAPKPNSNYRWSDKGLGTVANLGPSGRMSPDGHDRVTCLEEKASRKTVCYTRAQWQTIARGMQPPQGK